MKTRIGFLVVITLCVATVINAQTSKEVLVFGQKIQYVEAGSGPTVILLHGLGGSSQAWQFNIAALAEKHWPNASMPHDSAAQANEPS